MVSLFSFKVTTGEDGRQERKVCGLEEGPSVESLQISAAHPFNLCGSGVATLGRLFPHRSIEVLIEVQNEVLIW